MRGQAAVVVPMFRALIMIASVHRHGRVALTLSRAGGGGTLSKISQERLELQS